MGQIVLIKELEVDPEKIETMRDNNPPTNKIELQIILIITFLNICIPNTIPLRDLFHNDPSSFGKSTCRLYDAKKPLLKQFMHAHNLFGQNFFNNSLAYNTVPLTESEKTILRSRLRIVL